MSIYSCVDSISSIIKDKAMSVRCRKKYLSITSPLYSIKKVILNEAELVFLKDIKEKLHACDKNTSTLEEILAKISQYQANNSNEALKIFLQNIYSDLYIVCHGYNEKQNPPKKLSEKQIKVRDLYYRLIASRLLFRSLNQGTMQTRGNAQGLCYGFTMAMADSLLSPYKNPNIEKIELNRDIHDYQNSQQNRIADQVKIKKTRLTRRLFCPAFKSQAEELYSIAEQNIQKDLMIILENIHWMHSIYLHLQTDGKIRYVDPNHGVFLFDNKEQFISAYRILYTYERYLASPFRFYQVYQLTEDKNHELKDSRTLKGKWTSFLTGVKYIDPQNFAKLIKGIGIVTASLMITSITVLLTVGGTIGTVLPIIGIILGLVLLICAYVSPLLSTKGVLWGYHYCKNILHNTKDRNVSLDTGEENITLEIPPLADESSDNAYNNGFN